MKKKSFLLIIMCVFCTHQVFGQEPDEPVVVDVGTKTTGEAAAASKETASSNGWRNWVFACSALVAVAVGVTIVALNPGSSNSH